MTSQNGEHHITIPAHNPLKTGTLSAILNDVAQHFNISRDDIESIALRKGITLAANSGSQIYAATNAASSACKPCSSSAK